MCDIRAEQGWRSRAAFVDANRTGASLEDASRAAGWTSRTTYPKNRRRFPAWAARVAYEFNIADYRKAAAGTTSWTDTRTYGGPGSKWPFLRGLNF
jgi:hypothetical protein